MKKRPLANVEWRKYISVDNYALHTQLWNNSDEYLTGILSSIKNARSNKLSSFILIEFTNIDAVSILEKIDYPIALKRLLILCERLERYEVCAEIVKYEKSLIKTKTFLNKKSNKEQTLI